jgi:hypothetical protein
MNGAEVTQHVLNETASQYEAMGPPPPKKNTGTGREQNPGLQAHYTG